MAIDDKTHKEKGWLCKPQRRLGQMGLIVFILLTNVIIPFSIDMYTPAVPSLPAYFDTTAQVVNLTLVGFFLFMTLSSLVFGPISDQFGRKPVLVGSLVAYTVGGVLCAVSPNIVMLIAARLVQAVGAGAMMSVSMALVKDCFVAERREQMIAIIQVLSVVGPVIAPLAGGFLLNFFDWRASFVALAIFGGVCLVFSLLFEESLPESERRAGGVASTIGGLVAVGRNRSFMALLLMIALFNVAFSAYLAVGSYTYIDFFGTTPQEYTYFFAATAALTSFGPYIWLKAKPRVTPRRFTNLMICLGFVSAAVLLLFGESSVFAFCGALVLFATLQSAMRPYTTNILLSQQKSDTGAASSLISFTICIFGVIGMSIIVMGWPTYIFGIGVIMAVGVTLSCLLWVYLLRSPKTSIAELEK